MDRVQKVNDLILYNSFVLTSDVNPLQANGRLFYLKAQSLRRCKHFHLGYKNQSVCDVSGTSPCLFSDKYKTHKYSEGRAYNS